MERQEPRFDKDIKDVEFRSRSYRCTTLPSSALDNYGFAWKIGVAVGIGVLAALLISNAYERYPTRRDAEQVLQALKHETVRRESEARATVRSVAVPMPRPANVIYLVPLGYRCAGVPCCIGTVPVESRSRLDPITSTARSMGNLWMTVTR